MAFLKSSALASSDSESPSPKSDRSPKPPAASVEEMTCLIDKAPPCNISVSRYGACTTTDQDVSVG